MVLRGQEWGQNRPLSGRSSAILIRAVFHSSVWPANRAIPKTSRSSHGFQNNLNPSKSTVHHCSPENSPPPSAIVRAKGRRPPSRLDPGVFVCRDSRLRRGGEARRIGSRPAAGFVSEQGRAGSPKEECMKTILNTDRLNRLPGRIRPRWAHDLSPATAPCVDAGTAQPEESVPRNSAPCRELSPAPSERAVWRPISRLHNKERARYENPLISANPHFSRRGARILACRVAIPGDIASAQPPASLLPPAPFAKFLTTRLFDTVRPVA